MLPEIDVYERIDQVVDRYAVLEATHGLPQAGAIFECFKTARQADGSIPVEAELRIQARLGRSLAEQRRLRSQYDMLSQGVPGGASGDPAEVLFHKFLGDNTERQTIRLPGPLLANSGPNSYQIEDYLANGGYAAAAKALQTTPEEIIAEVKRSNLKGRGGAFFPVGIKWESVAYSETFPKFLVCNAEEGEPPTRKDKVLMDHNPHLLLEGLLIAGKAIGAHLGIIYLRGDYAGNVQGLEQAVADAHQAGWLGRDIQGSGFDFDVHFFIGSGSYVSGCDTAMIESIEGKAAIPRSTPPYPVENGVAGKPTVVNNVETLCNIPGILLQGGAAYAAIGDPDCPGTMIFGLSGDIAHPGMYELTTGTPLQEIIEMAGGVIERRNGQVQPGKLKAVAPGGVTTGLLNAEEVAMVRMDPKSLAALGISLGSGAIAVFNDTEDIRAFAEGVLEFLAEESCGRCMECPIAIRLTQATFARTHYGEAPDEEIEAIAYRHEFLPVILRCGLGKASHTTAYTAVSKFPDDFTRNMTHSDRAWS